MKINVHKTKTIVICGRNKSSNILMGAADTSRSQRIYLSRQRKNKKPLIFELNATEEDFVNRQCDVKILTFMAIY